MCAIRDAVRADLLGGSKSAYVRASKWAGQVFTGWARVLVGEDDPNDRRLQGRLAEGLPLPLSTSGGGPAGTRERLLDAMSENGLRVGLTRWLDPHPFGGGLAPSASNIASAAISPGLSNPSDAGGDEAVLAKREVIWPPGRSIRLSS